MKLMLKNMNGVVITSLPSLKPSISDAITNASVLAATPIACFAPVKILIYSSKVFTSLPIKYYSNYSKLHIVITLQKYRYIIFYFDCNKLITLFPSIPIPFNSYIFFNK